MRRRSLAIGICLLMICSGLLPLSLGYNVKIAKNETEYWALLIAVGVYAEHPEKDIPSMLTVVEKMHDLLLVSEHWKEDHIKVIKGENATIWNIIKGLLWLNKMDDRDDFSLVYITTHGGQIDKDKFPFDEKDGKDEVLASYRGYQYQWTNIRDDLLNLFLSLLSAKGVCVIVDSCFSGGFNDPPYFKGFMRNKPSYLPRYNNRISTLNWIQELGDDLQGKGRVVLMSVREDELSYGNYFTNFLVKALQGYADTNEDDFVTAEEAFVYVEENFPEWLDMHPTIFDKFPGELVLTEVELPPSKPDTPNGQIIGYTNISYNYSTVSIDPEGGKISYGWDWDGDYTVDEWTEPVNSNIAVNTSHIWTLERTYNIRVKAKDEKGLISDWSNHIVVIMCSDNIPDQQQTMIDKGSLFSDFWVAMSFVPSFNNLSKVELCACSYGAGDPKPLHLYIRDSLTGDNLVEISDIVPYVGSYQSTWFTFDFEDLYVIPGNTYYIVCKGLSNWSYIWRWEDENPYTLGKAFVSEDGINWGGTDYDFCFVTWGKP